MVAPLFNLFANTFETSVYMILHKAIGLNSVTLFGHLNFGFRLM